MNKHFGGVVALFYGFLLLCSEQVSAAEYLLPSPGNDVVGEEQMVQAKEEDTLIDIGRRHGLGFDEIVLANAAVDTWLPREGTSVLLPLRFVLPNAPRTGIVINVAEMRLYYYPKPAKGEPAVVRTYPISIGRSDWNTPLTSTTVVRKAVDPTWYPPASLRKERRLEGDPPLPASVGPGPDNPLGRYALYLGIDSYLIHGTNEAKASGIGMQVTHGCVRMYPEDIATLFKQVPVGTPVRIVNQPHKLGWLNGALYVELHPWLEGSTEATQQQDERQLQEQIRQQVAAAGAVVDEKAVSFAEIERNGIPIPITHQSSPVAVQSSVAEPSVTAEPAITAEPAAPSPIP